MWTKISVKKKKRKESESCILLFWTPWTRPEYWNGEPFPSLGDLPNPGNEPGSPALQADSLPTEPSGKLRK